VNNYKVDEDTINVDSPFPYFKRNSLALRHCLRFSWAVFPGGAAADNKRGSTAWIAEGKIPATSPENSNSILTLTKTKHRQLAFC
jgi:hypothetical protein